MLEVLVAVVERMAPTMPTLVLLELPGKAIEEATEERVLVAAALAEVERALRELTS
jgi:hypothetical protein